MQYLLIICDDPAERTADQARILAAYRSLTDDLRKTGKLLGANALEPVTTATTIRVRAGKRLVTDGPFAESKEDVAGYYLIEARDLDEAIGIAARVPSASFGAVEVRPVRRS